LTVELITTHQRQLLNNKTTVCAIGTGEYVLCQSFLIFMLSDWKA